MPLLELRRMSCVQGGRILLQDVDLAVEPGEIHALLGANGAGKSTLAYLVMGCEGYVPSSGEILFQGQSLAGVPLHERARRGITLAWHEPARFEGLPVGTYLRLGGVRRPAAECLRRVGLKPEDYLGRTVDRTLSGGERKRIELASVLAMGPRLAMLDEPVSGIDMLSQDEIAAVIRLLKEAGTAVLLITHDEDSARLADRATLLSGGRVVETGEAGPVADYYLGRGAAYA